MKFEVRFTFTTEEAQKVIETLTGRPPDTAGLDAFLGTAVEEVNSGKAKTDMLVAEIIAQKIGGMPSVGET